MSSKPQQIGIIALDPAQKNKLSELLTKSYLLEFFDTLNGLLEYLKRDDYLKNPLGLLIIDISEELFDFYEQIQSSLQKFSLSYILILPSDRIDFYTRPTFSFAKDLIALPYHDNEFCYRVSRALSGRLENINIFDNYQDKEIKGLTLKEHLIFSLFLNSPGKMLSRKEILNHIWSEVKVQEKTVDVHLFNLRKKLKAYGYEITTSKNGQWILNKVLISV